MKNLAVIIPCLLGAMLLLAADQPKIQPLPIPVTNNAVASLHGGLELYSLMGIGPKRTWNAITNQVFALHLSAGKWSEGRPVPGVAGRLGASAAGAKNHVYLFGGYVVDGQYNEMIVANVDAYLPEERRWARGEDMPVPVHDAIVGVIKDRYIYLIGGKSKNGPVNRVQVYDVDQNKWSPATPFPGTPVFGHAGGIAEETIVYVDGAKKNAEGASPAYIASDECWMGKIDHKDPLKITWTKLPAHPGPARFAIVAGAGEKDRKIYFSGGATLPYTFKGLDANGKPPVISPTTFTFDTHGSKWETITDDTDDARADSHGILATPVGHIILGGTTASQEITAHWMILPKRAE